MHTVQDPLRRAVTTAHNRCAVICGDDRFTFEDFERRCRQLTSALRQLGAKRGDRIAVLADNCHRYLELYVAVPAAGLVIVPLNTRHTISELRYILSDATPTVLVADRRVDDLDDLTDHVIDLGTEYEPLLAETEPDPWPTDLAASDLAGLFYTGGTTGASKGVMLTHASLIANTWHTLVSANLNTDDTYLVMAPMFHAAGSIAALAMIWLGAPQVIQPTFDPAAVLASIDRHQITVTLGVPTMLSAINRAHDATRSTGSLRLLFYGGSPIATDVVRASTTTFPNAEMCHLYGATELAPLATVLRHHEHHLDDDLAMSCGQAVVGVDLTVTNDDNQSTGIGAIGHVMVRGPNVMNGYWNKPDQTAEVMHDGWYRTGDLGRLDHHGNLTLVDRAKDMIVTGGENVYSTEVEEALHHHPAIIETAVFGIPDPEWGEAVHAVIVTTQSDLTADDLRTHCRSLISGYKVPKTFTIQPDELPKSGAGKILKRVLRDQYWSDRPTGVQ